MYFFYFGIWFIDLFLLAMGANGISEVVHADTRTWKKVFLCILSLMTGFLLSVGVLFVLRRILVLIAVQNVTPSSAATVILR